IDSSAAGELPGFRAAGPASGVSTVIAPVRPLVLDHAGWTTATCASLLGLGQSVTLDRNGRQSKPPARGSSGWMNGSVTGGRCGVGAVSAKRSGRGGICLLYPSDAADDLVCVDLGGR